nr:acyl-CoA carboxylase subunit beta [Nanchangia anserum]
MSTAHVLPLSSPTLTRAEFARRSDELAAEAEKRARERQHPRGRMTARERLDHLLDEGSLRETDRFAGAATPADFLGSGVITGFGRIGGREVAVYAQDFSVRGGSLGDIEGEKIARLMRQAIDRRLPLFALLDSGGARIQDGVTSLARYGQIFALATEASGVIPQISVVLGPCAGGAVYGPALTDIVIMEREASYMFVTGPKVVQAATGEKISSADLGGADMHGSVSGVAHMVIDGERESLDAARAVLSYLPSHCGEAAPRYAFDGDDIGEAHARRVGDLVPEGAKQAYDMRDVIEALVDYGEFVEIHEHFAASVVVGFACIDGRAVGIVANQPNVDAGTLDVAASEKAARFVTLCDTFGLPVVTLVDVPGYRPGSEQERAGIIRRGAKLITAYASASVPLVTVIVRKAYGGAYIVMGSKSLGADVALAWPGAEIAVMGAEGAVDILHGKSLAAAERPASTSRPSAPTTSSSGAPARSRPIVPCKRESSTVSSIRAKPAGPSSMRCG